MFVEQPLAFHASANNLWSMQNKKQHDIGWKDHNKFFCLIWYLIFKLVLNLYIVFNTLVPNILLVRQNKNC